MEAGSAPSQAAPAIAFKARLPPPTNLDLNCNDTNTHVPLDDESQLFLTSWVHDDNFSDIHLDVALMPQFLQPPADSPSSTLSSTSTTQFAFEDSQSSASSSGFSLSSASSLRTDGVFFGDPFSATNTAAGEYFDDPLFTTPFVQIKPESCHFLSTFDVSLDMATVPFEYNHPEPVHRSIDIPSSPQLTLSAFTPMESYERTIPEPSVRTYEDPMTAYGTAFVASLSSEEASKDLMPAASLPPKKPARVSKQDKGIKCDHCGVDKTPLWRKVPRKENAYHCNACGLYYKSNGHFRVLEGESRVARHKKSRKSSDPHHPSNARSGPVTANRNLACYNCNTNTTVLWRKGPEGQSPLCNPCGLFYKLHGTHRDPEKKKEIHRRNRTGKKRFSLPLPTRRGSWSNSDSEGDDEDETDTAESPVVSHFEFRRHSTESYHVNVKDEMDYSGTMVSPVQEFMGPIPYQFQWPQTPSVHGRC